MLIFGVGILQFDHFGCKISLQESRRVITIGEKLPVVDFYEKMLKEKQEHEKIVQEPRSVKVSAKQRKEEKNRKIEARKKMQRNIQKECAKIFPTEL